MDDPDIWDAFRAIIISLYGFSIGETALIARRYSLIVKKTRRLLPWHVAAVSVGMLGLEAEAVWQNIEKVGQGFSWYVPVNLVLFSAVYFALISVRRHITRKVDTQQEFLPLLQEPLEFD